MRGLKLLFDESVKEVLDRFHQSLPREGTETCRLESLSHQVFQVSTNHYPVRGLKLVQTSTDEVNPIGFHQSLPREGTETPLLGCIWGKGWVSTNHYPVRGLKLLLLRTQISCLSTGGFHQSLPREGTETFLLLQLS